MSSPSSVPSPRTLPLVRIAGGRLMLSVDDARLAVVATAPDGAAAHAVLPVPAARAWAARVAVVLDAHPPSDDVTPVELRTPWARDEDGAPVLAVERIARGPQVTWRVLVEEAGTQLALEVAGGDVAELLRRLQSPPEAARSAG